MIVPIENVQYRDRTKKSILDFRWEIPFRGALNKNGGFYK